VLVEPLLIACVPYVVVLFFVLFFRGRLMCSFGDVSFTQKELKPLDFFVLLLLFLIPEEINRLFLCLIVGRLLLIF